jgi:hypothetical protein
MDEKRDMSAAQLARILREARARGASVSEVIEKGLAAIRGRGEPSAQQALIQPPVQSVAPGKQDAAQLRKIIAALVQSGGKWNQLQPLAWKLFELEPDDRHAAQMLELCALHGSRPDLVDLAGLLVTAGKDFYFHLHPLVRERLTVILWAAGRFELVSAALMKLRESAQLLPAERLVVFLFLASGRDPAPAYMYFRTHRIAILDAARSTGVAINSPFDEILLRAARLALDLGFEFDVRELIRQIPRDSVRHADGVEVLNQTLKEIPAAEAGQFEVRISEGSWQQRIECLEQRLNKVRNLSATRDPGRARVNEVLKSIISYFPELPEAWAQLSHALVMNRDLSGFLPALYCTFHDNALVFHPAPLDAALWQGPLKVTPEMDDLRHAFWHGVALMHQYVANGSGHEETLWKSRRLVASVASSADFVLPLRWSDLLRAATQHVSRHPSISASEREIMLLQLGIAGDPDSFSAHDIDQYLARSWRTPLVVLDELERIAVIKKSPDTQRHAILKKAAVSALTNLDLDKIFSAATQTVIGPAADDLCWRVASILSVRQALQPAAKHALEISGEKRSFYPFMTASLAEVESVALKGLPSANVTFMRAILRIGPRLPSLLSLFDSRARVLKPVTAPAGSPQSAVDKAIRDLPWLAGKAPLYRFSHEQAVFSGIALPPYVQIAPANQWGLLFVLLGHFLGLHSWECKVSRLVALNCEIIPRVAHLPEYKGQAGKVARWLRELSAEQRIAWQDLTSSCRTFTDQEAADMLASVIARIAIMIHPDHQSALTALRQMRVDLPVLRDLEAWLLDIPYSEYRASRDLLSRIMVPLNLRRQTGISATRISADR